MSQELPAKPPAKSETASKAEAPAKAEPSKIEAPTKAPAPAKAELPAEASAPSGGAEPTPSWGAPEPRHDELASEEASAGASGEDLELDRTARMFGGEPPDLLQGARARFDAIILAEVERRGLIRPCDRARAENLLADSARAPRAVFQQLLMDGSLSARGLQRVLEDADLIHVECGACTRLVPLSEAQGWDGACGACESPLALDGLASMELSAAELMLADEADELVLYVGAEERPNELARFTILGELGRGGFGVVFKALDRETDAVVALKTFRTQGRRPAERARFLREGEAMKRLDHPNIVGVRDFGQQGDLLFIAMDYVRGRPFRSHLREGMPLEAALDVLESILEAVAYAHGAGVLHRDLKPSNMLVIEESGQGRLFDFGLAKDELADGSVTEHREIVGTPFYTSPDQIVFGADKVDGRSDIFSLGVLLYEILTGTRPFLAPTRSELYTRILHHEPKAPRSLRPELPEALTEVCMKALTKDRRERYQSAEEMAEALREARGDRSPERGIVSSSGEDLVPYQRTAPPRSPTIDGRGRGRRASRPRPESRLFGRSGAKDRKRFVASPSALRQGGRLRRPTARGLAAGWWLLVIIAILVFLLAFFAVSPALGQDAAPAAPPARKRSLDEYPKLKTSEWIHRAFFVNDLLEEADDERAIGGLALALQDREELVRGFALRGLLARTRSARLRHGGLTYAEGLLFAMKSREPFLRGNAGRLLSELAGDEGPSADASPSVWRAWWRRNGLIAVERALAKQPAEPGGAAGAKGEEREKTGVGKTKERGGRSMTTNQYFTAVKQAGLEVVFVIDITTSMGEELARVREQVQEITGFFMHLLPRKVRLGFVTYDNEVIHVAKLTSRLPKFARAASKLRIYKNPKNKTYCEGLDKGLSAALDIKKMGWLKKSFKTIVILGDAPPHPPDRAATLSLAKKAADAGFTINALVAEPPGKALRTATPYAPLKAIAKAGKGVSVKLNKPEELITRLLVLSFGPEYEDDLRRFVTAYREVTGKENEG